MKKFFKNKNNLIFLITSAIVIVAMITSSIFPVVTFLSFMIFGVYCIYVAYLLFKRYLQKRNSKIDEFLDGEEQKARKRTSFLEGESRTNLILLVVLFVFVGAMLFYYGLISI